MAHTRPLKEAILQAARDAGFAAARILTGLPAQKTGHPALLVTALSYGNGEEDRGAGEDPDAVLIAPFARRNYYREAVTRFQRLASGFRRDFG
ncbi:MAG: hypothetical protein LBC88_10350, partial [Spirochaetaceae bacterium]|nr:hypothetical protein [Spirochaetaceae bacterium]